jgi:hypothetical protein
MELSKVYQTMHGEELKARTDVTGLEATEASLAASLEKSRSRIPKPALEAEHNALQLQLAILESDYKKLATLRQEVRDAELTSGTEAYVLYRATPQDAPARPIKIYHVLLSGLLALVLGVGVLYLVDYGRWLLATSGSGKANPSEPGLPGERQPWHRHSGEVACKTRQTSDAGGTIVGESPA